MTKLQAEQIRIIDAKSAYHRHNGLHKQFRKKLYLTESFQNEDMRSSQQAASMLALCTSTICNLDPCDRVTLKRKIMFCSNHKFKQVFRRGYTTHDQFSLPQSGFRSPDL